MLEAIRLGLRTGDDSREARGDWLTELLAEDCLEATLSCEAEVFRVVAEDSAAGLWLGVEAAV